ncbi:uncharacterized protein [Dermacentor albipictus]|uniref:uncharacterized protein isoform X2 n=1 Tax=Dermacentor albipictus TaxID=60249 RepID=UPI0038FD0ABF
MASHMLPNFDDVADKWKPYLIKVEAYFEANAISDSTKKRALLVAALSTSTIQILMGRIAPAKPNALSYDEVVGVLNDHYDPKRNEIAESFQFFNRCQQENESIHDFFVAIRRIADNCNFGDSLSRLLRDRIVCGVRSKAVQKQLLSKKELTLEEAESIAIAAETAEKDARTMSVDVPPVLKVEAHRKLPSRSSTESAGRLECGRCGSFRHDSNSCRWAKALCYSCGQRGHLAKMCRSRNGNRVPSNRSVHHAKALAVEDAVSEEDNSDSAHIWTLASARKNALQPPIRRTFSWGGVDLSMEVDTGSPVCVISRQLFDKHHKCWPSLKPSHVKLSCYNGRLPVVGELQLCVKYRDISVNCALVVLDCPGPSLCGRDLLMLLEQAGVPVLQVTGEGEATADQVDCHRIHAICDTYQDVFSETLGLIKGPPASLLLKGDAVPKFCREFVLVSDHQPLLGLLRPDRQTPAMAAARIQRWALYLGGYRYKLEYAPGRLLLNADALSRLPLQGSDLVTEPDPEERTPQKTGKSPSEMLLGYQIRSRLDTCFPAATVSNSKKENDEWLPPTDCSVHVRNYGSNGKWIPGRVTATSGGRMITVETPQAIVRRHIDQVRTRTESSPDKPPGTDPGLISRDRTQSAPPLCQEPSASPEDAGESSPQEAFRDLDHQIPVPPPVASGADQVPMQPVRRSTRSRKPVQRF